MGPSRRLVHASSNSVARARVLEKGKLDILEMLPNTMKRRREDVPLQQKFILRRTTRRLHLSAASRSSSNAAVRNRLCSESARLPLRNALTIQKSKCKNIKCCGYYARAAGSVHRQHPEIVLARLGG